MKPNGQRNYDTLERRNMVDVPVIPATSAPGSPPFSVKQLALVIGLLMTLGTLLWHTAGLFNSKASQVDVASQYKDINAKLDRVGEKMNRADVKMAEITVELKSIQEMLRNWKPIQSR